MERVRYESEDWFFIFHGIERDFEDLWLKKRSRYKQAEWGKYKALKWRKIADWIGKYSELMSSIIPQEHIACRVETKQQYKRFEKSDLLNVLAKLGELGQHMYCAERDIFEASHVLFPEEDHPLLKYYISALERVVWCVASFVNSADSGSSFTSLVDRLSELLES